MWTRLAFLKTWGGLNSAGSVTLDRDPAAEGELLAAAALVASRPKSADASDKGFMLTSGGRAHSLTASVRSV